MSGKLVRSWTKHKRPRSLGLSSVVKLEERFDNDWVSISQFDTIERNLAEMKAALLTSTIGP